VVGVLAHAFQAVLRSGLLPGEVSDDDIELGGEAGEIGGGEGEEGAEGFGVGAQKRVVGVFVRLAARAVEDGLRLPEPGEGAFQIATAKEPLPSSSRT